MPVGLSQPDELLPVKGIRLAATSAGIRYKNRDDLVLIQVAEGTRVAGVFTRNAFCAAPVIVARRHLSRSMPRCLLINSGNANAGTGEAGIADANASCAMVAEQAGCHAQEVLPFSTGVIGEPLPTAVIEAAIPELVQQADESGWMLAARAIMTTDTLPKAVSESVTLSGGNVVITGIAKGAGMIRPDMATMLAFIGTDAKLDDSLIQTMHLEAVQQSFNRVTVDGDTSTNDACILMASGQSGVMPKDDSDRAVFQQALNRVYRHLAQALVRDGEGATKFVEIRVDDARDEQEALKVAYTVAHSPLVKTALFASDPNWGRILAAVGRSGIENMDVDRISIDLGEVRIVDGGGRAASYTEAQGQKVMDQDEICISIRLGRGDANATVWTSDLSFDYVKINAEYRS
jgi:glutamate N-acetyltransferase / amino-acid N-acetyltransferase